MISTTSPRPTSIQPVTAPLLLLLPDVCVQIAEDRKITSDLKAYVHELNAEVAAGKAAKDKPQAHFIHSDDKVKAVDEHRQLLLHKLQRAVAVSEPSIHTRTHTRITHT